MADNNFFENIRIYLQNNIINVFTILIVILIGFCSYIYPMSADDFLNTFFYASNYQLKINTFTDAIQNANLYYVNWNGRYFANFFVTVFVNLLPQFFMFFVGSLSILLSVLLIKKISNFKFNIIYVFLLFWLLIPDKNETLFWKTGIFNYGVVGLFSLLFVYLILKFNSKSLWQNLLLFIYSFFTAFQHEALSIPIAGAISVYALFKLKHLNKTYYFMSVGFIIGSLLCVFSPGTFIRLNADSSIAMQHNFSFYLWAIIDASIALISLFVLILLFMIRFKNNHVQLKLFLSENLLIILVVLIGILLNMFISIKGDIPDTRAWYFVVLFALVLIFNVVSTFKLFQNKSILYFSSIFMLLLVSYTAINLNSKHVIAYNEFEQIKKSKDGIVPIDVSYLTSNPNEWINRAMSSYFHKDSIVAYPSTVYSYLYNNDKNNITVEKLNDWIVLDKKYFILPINLLNDSTMKSIIWTKQLKIPLISKKKFVSSPNYEIIIDRFGHKFLFLTNNKTSTTVTDIKIYY